MAKKINHPINNPHDRFFKATINSPCAIQDFFKAHLPQSILAHTDLSTIKPAKASHVSSSLKESLNDLVFTCQIDKNPGFLIIEHQSSPDWHMPLRFMNYNLELLAHYMKGKKPGTLLPYIFNICITHGKLNKPYAYSNSFYDYYPNPVLAKDLAPFVKFELYNITSCCDDELESHETIGLMEKLFKYQGEQTFFEVLGKELERCKDWILGTPIVPAPLGEDYWKSIFYYASNVLDPAWISEEKLIGLFHEKLFINKEEIMRTIARQIEKRGEIKGLEKGIEQGIEKGIAKGIAKGIEQGIQENRLTTAKSMLKRELAISLIQEVTGLSQEMLEQLNEG